jgi:hypothetical protein
VLFLSIYRSARLAGEAIIVGPPFDLSSTETDLNSISRKQKKGRIMRPNVHSRTSNFSKPAAHVPDICPKCGQRTIVLDRNTNIPRCNNMICGYRASGGRRSGNRTTTLYRA